MTPVESKVKASTTAAAVSGIALWIIGRYAFKGSVPDVVTSWTYAIVPSILTFIAGYLAKHTPRPAAVRATPGLPPEKTLIPPAAAAAEQPPAAAGPAAPAAPE